MRKLTLQQKARNALRRRLERERQVYGVIGTVVSISVIPATPSVYEGKGDGFETWVEFEEGFPKSYLVVLHGRGKSSMIYEL